ncbi:MAG: Rrf2 family transcriptional regulator, partial [Planctomycetota bacterium]
RLLVQQGLVHSQRGPTGGFTIARDPSAVSLLDIVDAVSPIPRIRACPMRIGTHCHSLCPLHTMLDTLAEEAQTMLASTDLASILARPTRPLDLKIGSCAVMIGENTDTETPK